MILLCKDCVYLRQWPSTSYYCAHPENMQMSLVSGLQVQRQYAEFCRSDTGHCGPTGKHFEQYTPSPETKWQDPKRTDGDLDIFSRPLRPGS